MKEAKVWLLEKALAKMKMDRNWMHRRAQRAEADLHHIMSQQPNKALVELRIARADLETKEEGRLMVLKRFAECEEQLATTEIALAQHHASVYTRMALVPPAAATCSICGMELSDG